MNNIAEKTIALLGSGDNNFKKYIFTDLRKEVVFCLKNKDYKKVIEQLFFLKSNSYFSEYRFLEKIIFDVVNVVDIEDFDFKDDISFSNDMRVVSNLFFLPCVVTNKSIYDHIVLPPLENIENYLNNFIKNINIFNDFKIILAPVVVGNKTAEKMWFDKLYDLHDKVLNTKNERSLRDIFTKNFKLNNNGNKSYLFFITGLFVGEENYNCFQQIKKHLLFDDLQRIIEDLNDNKINIVFSDLDFFKDAYCSGNNILQNFEIYDFLNSNNEFLIVQNKESNALCLFAIKDGGVVGKKIINFYLTPLKEVLSDLVGFVMQNNKKTYLSNKVVDFTNIDNIDVNQIISNSVLLEKKIDF